jgi:hypothetical protein
MAQIPKLIKEKVNFYYYRYYREKWATKMEHIYGDLRKRLQIMGNEESNQCFMVYNGLNTYFCNFICYIRCRGYNNEITLGDQAVYINGHETDRGIRTFLYPDNYDEDDDNYEDSDDNRYKAELPKRYFYSSGLNNMKGYNNCLLDTFIDLDD